MSILSALQDYLKTYGGISAKPVWAEYLGALPGQYSVVPLPGQRTIETYLNNSRLKAFPFALESTVSDADDVTRLENNSVYESFADWLDTQSDASNFPTLPEKHSAEKIEATSSGFLMERTASDTGIYHIVCMLTYTQTP